MHRGHRICRQNVFVSPKTSAETDELCVRTVITGTRFDQQCTRSSDDVKPAAGMGYPNEITHGVIPDLTVIISGAHACLGYSEGIRPCMPPDSSPAIIPTARVETRHDVIDVASDQHSPLAIPCLQTGSSLHLTSIDKHNFTTPLL